MVPKGLPHAVALVDECFEEVLMTSIIISMAVLMAKLNRGKIKTTAEFLDVGVSKGS